MVPGSHAFGFPVERSSAFRVYIETPDQILADRFAKEPVPPNQVNRVIKSHMANNADLIRPDREAADLLIDGTAEPETQIDQFLAGFQERFGVTDRRR